MSDGSPFKIPKKAQDAIEAAEQEEQRQRAEARQAGADAAARRRELQEHGLEARTTDPDTSWIAGALVEQREGKTFTVKPGTHKHVILASYAEAGRPLTDFEAWSHAGLSHRSAPWHRCSDLLDGGMIEYVDETIDTETGKEVRRCSISKTGRNALRVLDGGGVFKVGSDDSPDS